MILEHEKQDKDLNKATPENLLLNLTRFLSKSFQIIQDSNCTMTKIESE